MNQNSGFSGYTIEGHAIISADGMIADASGAMPGPLRNDADFAAFQSALDSASLVVLGRRGHARHPNTGRRRLVFTRAVQALQADPADPFSTYYNPSGMDLPTALTTLGIPPGVLAITGGQSVFDVFLPLYDRFILSETNAYALPGGIECFSNGHPRSVLARAGLSPSPPVLIDPANAVTTTIWSR